jgi:hypothetical protein
MLRYKLLCKTINIVTILERDAEGGHSALLIYLSVIIYIIKIDLKP